MIVEDALKALAEPNRRRILEVIDGSERTAGEIADRFAVTRSAVSQHLSVLKAAGLVNERREGTRRLYSVRPEGFAQTMLLLESFWDLRLHRLRRALSADLTDVVSAERLAIQRDTVLDAPPELVWPLLTAPDQAVRWMGVSADLDPVPGGRYRVEVVPGEVVVGTFLTVDEPHRLSHTWGWVGADGTLVTEGSTIVTYELVPVAAGTLLRLTHEHLPTIATTDSHARGWRHYIQRLGAIVAGSPLEPDPWVEDTSLMLTELGLRKEPTDDNT